MRNYTKAGSCSALDTVFVPPCPVDMYARDGVCLVCPPLSRTLGDGATSIVSCFLGGCAFVF